MITSLQTISVLALLATSQLTLAGGPLILEGANGNTPVTYSNPNISLNAETGPLGTAFTNPQADDLMRDAFSLWNNVNTSNINLNLDESQITNDVNLSNSSGLLSNANDNLNPVIYDANGEIIDDFFGADASLETAGFAASFFTNKGNFFLEGYAVINGRVPPPPQVPLSASIFKLLIAHEMGHLFGLDHSQVDINNQENTGGAAVPICQTATQNKYPVMYPFICRSEVSLHADDISAVSTLYPAANFNSSFGTIEGEFTSENGVAILGANIWAENTATGEVVSIVSDFLKQGTGFYQLHLTPGTYTLHANSINTLFFDGSSIGPYALFEEDKSFIAPHPITEVTLQNAAGNTEVLTVVANQAIIAKLTAIDTVVAPPQSSGGGGSFSPLTIFIFIGLLLPLRQRQAFLELMPR